MKRIIILMLFFLLLSGCDAHQQVSTKESITTCSTEESVVTPAETDFFGSCLTLEDYKEFCRNPDVEMPVNFLRYEQIDELGQFHAIHFMGIAKVDVFWYQLTDEEERSFSIWVYPKGFYHVGEDPTPPTPEDMRSISVSHYNRMYISVDDEFKYYYQFGKLDQIFWNIDGVDYKLAADFAQFEPDPNGTFVERMLCLESAPAAVEEFAQMISTPYTPEGEVVP